MAVQNERPFRTPPRERFASEVSKFDIKTEIEKLRAEPGEGQRGHRQVALYKHDQATVALFRFEKGGELPEHKTEGTVLIQVLGGEIEVRVEGRMETLNNGQMLAVSPGTPHSVLAMESSVMLLTVCMEGESKE